MDTNDVEVVLALLRVLSARGSDGDVKVMTSAKIGPHVMWILDFDCYGKMPMNEEGVRQAVDAFFRNDPCSRGRVRMEEGTRGCEWSSARSS